MSKDFPKQLLVEGATDRRVIPELIEKLGGIPWGEKANEAIVSIRDADGISKLIESSFLSTKLKESRLQILGIIADADQDANAIFLRIRDRCLHAFPDFPETLPETGLVLQNKDSLRFGIWIMPDNRSRNMLETFLAYLVDNADPLKYFAEEVIVSAKEKGAPYKEIHRDKALVHTWLAWQDEPGNQLHHAVMFKMLKGNSLNLQKFLNWFRDLYQLT